MPDQPMNVYALRATAASSPRCRRCRREGALPAGLDFANVEVAPPRDAAHGDLACNAAHGAGQGGAG